MTTGACSHTENKLLWLFRSIISTHMAITQNQIEAAYLVASQVFDGRLTTQAGATLLHSVHGLNVNSARDFIRDYRHLLRGEIFHRSMSAPAMDYFLTRIGEKRGGECLHQSVIALGKHIEYYEGIRQVNLSSMRAVLARHEASLLAPVDLTAYAAEFDKRVADALTDSLAERQKRIQAAPKLPIKVQATVGVYLRNPDVVAEVLSRAKGVCEGCTKPAPFLKKADGKPYLEVHHVQLLANGGEDTPENAIALCPNCHRERHFGI